MNLPACPNRPFEEFHAGQRLVFDAAFSAADVEQFAKLSGDWNPLHVDAGYAVRTPFRQQVVHGLLVSSLLSRVAGMAFPGQQSLLLQIENLAFHNPVTVAEPLQCEAEIVEVHRIFRILVVSVRVRGRYDQLKVSAQLKVQYRAPARPTIALPKMEELMQTNLSNRVALVTGASRGIGAAVAEALGQCGAKVIVNYSKSGPLADEVAQRITKAGGQALTVQADVTDRAAVTAMVRQARDKFGAVDLFVHNATAPVVAAGFCDLTWDLLLRDFEVQVRGAYNCLQEFLPGMAERKYGRIVSMLSVYLDSPPPKSVGSYVTAKSALRGLTRTVASEYGHLGITANMVSPSMVETDLTADMDDRAKKVIASRIPLGRLAQPADIVGPVLFLLSPAAVYINGATLSVNGGLQF